MFTAIGILAVLLLLLVGTAMVVRYAVRRRIARAEEQLPENSFSGTALLVGTNFDPSLKGIGAMAVTEQALVFVKGSDGRSIHIPRATLAARSYRRKPQQRAASLRVEWGGNIAQFEVDRPSVAEWVQQLA